MTPPELLADLWAADGRSLIPAAVTVLNCVDAWSADQANDRMLAEAARAAHGLAGTLGLFGFGPVADIAGELEDRFELMLGGELRPQQSGETVRTQELASELLAGVRAAASAPAQ